MAEIALSSAVRSNLLALQNTSGFIDRTQNRLSTGLEVSSPIDDAIKFFQAKSLSNRATDLLERKDAIDQGVNALNTALKAADAMEDLVKQMKGVIDQARSGDKTQRTAYKTQLQDLGTQIEKLVNDASYQGLNLINSTGSKLAVRFSDKQDSKLEVNGVNFQISGFFKKEAGTAITHGDASKLLTGGLGFTAAIDSGYSLSKASEAALFNAAADKAINALDKTVSNLRSEAAKMAGNVAILQVRSNFTQEYSNVLESGAAQLTVADLNEEGANLLALQTRQQMGIQALSFAGQSEQAVLGLFR
ncbi:flagellin [Desulfosediminicola sp.]|jgi:flagellin-like hook-associated protein FlgL|uniref:flagellin N-terminal helical domain-containing protein n=1 Tax=Desulfosediminicola sp. TaxID=2886825 RepID=UPI003AF2F98E